MKFDLTRKEALESVSNFFSKNSFLAKEMKNIKKIANKFRISLKSYKKFFCKKCLSPLKGNIRISSTHKSVVCQSCNYRNKFKINH